MVQDNREKTITYSTGPTSNEIDHNPVDLDEIKYLGLYTDQEFVAIKELFDQLTKAIHVTQNPTTLALYPLKKILIRVRSLHEAPTPKIATELESCDDLPDDPSISNKNNYLFFCDSVALLLGIAKSLQSNFAQYTDRLRLYSREFGEEDELKKWAGSPNKEYISQPALQRSSLEIGELIKTISLALYDIEVELNGINGEQEYEDTSSATPAAFRSAVVPTVVAEIDAAEGTSPEDQETLQDVPRKNSAELQLELEQQEVWILSRARTQLLDDLLRKNGFNPDDLPPELAFRYQELLSILDSQLKDIVSKLPYEDQERLLAGDISERIKLYYRLLNELATHTENGFFVNYTAFYETQTTILLERGNITEARSVSENVAEIFQSEDIANITELDQIRQEIKKWEVTIIERIRNLPTPEEKSEAQITRTETEEPTSTQTATTHDDDLDEPFSIPDAQPIRVSLTQNLQLLEIANKSSSHADQTVIPNRTGHVIWGTMANLFTEADLTANNIPPALFNSVTDVAITYLSNLSPEELHKLAKSPSALIRHIQNISLRVQMDMAFVQEYQNFQSSHITPTFVRSDRIEAESKLAIENINYELFESHNINKTLTGSDPDLNVEYLRLQKDLEVKVFSVLLGLDNEYLQLLYLSPNERKNLLFKLHRDLNTDPRFIQQLTSFYNELVVYFAKQQMIVEQEELVESLRANTNIRITIQQDSSVKILVDGLKDTDSHEVFMDQLRKTLKIDGPSPILRNTEVILDSLLLTHGVNNTQKLITQIPQDLLALTFGLEITDANNNQVRKILAAYAEVRAEIIRTLTETKQPLGMVATDSIPTNAASLVRHLEPTQAVKELVDEDGTEKTTLALHGGVKKRMDALEKVLGQRWKNLNLEERATVYLYYDKPFDAGLKQRFKTKNDSEEDKHLLSVIFEYSGFDDSKLKTLVANARENRFQRLTLSAPPILNAPNGNVDEAVYQYYQEVKRSRQIELQLARSLYLEYEALEQEEIARRYNYANAAALFAAYGMAEQRQMMFVPVIQDFEAFDDPQGVAYDQAAPIGPLPAGATGPVQNLASQIRSKAKDKIFGAIKSRAKKQVAGEVAASAATKLAMSVGTKAAAAATGVGTAVAVGSMIWELLKNEKTRDFIIGLGTYGVATIASILTNVAGLLGFLGGMLLGTFTPLGFFGGFFGGLALGKSLASLFPSWRIPGLDVRMPQAPWNIGAEQPISNMPSMQQLRGKAGAPNSPGGSASAKAGAPGQAGAQNVAGKAGTSSAAQSSSAANAARSGINGQPQSQSGGFGGARGPFSVSPTAASASGIYATLSALPIAIMAPFMGIGTVFIMTILVVTVIAGAFLVPVPTRYTPGTSGTNIGTSKYFELSKTADPAKIANNQDTEFTYTVTLTPKDGSSIQITAVNDTFSSYGEQKKDITSPAKLEDFPTEPITEPKTVTYKTTFGAGFVDALVSNHLVITFDVTDKFGYEVSKGEQVTAVAAVVIGNPKIGCFVFAPATAVVPGTAVSSSAWPAKYQQRVMDAFLVHVGSNAHYNALLCSKGPITLYYHPGTQYGGWTTSANTVMLYDLGLMYNTYSTEYTIVHEFGHIIDLRNAGLRQQFTALLTPQMGCFTYPFPSMCRPTEAFAEAISISVTNWQSYNIKKHTEVYNWVKTNIFGGEEYF